MEMTRRELLGAGAAASVAIVLERAGVARASGAPLATPQAAAVAASAAAAFAPDELPIHGLAGSCSGAWRPGGAAMRARRAFGECPVQLHPVG